MVTNTMPIFSKVLRLPIVVAILYPIKPISRKKIGKRIHRLLEEAGIFFFLEILLTQKSTKLPLGQRFPQNHRPLKGLIKNIAAKTNSIKYPSTGYQSPPIETIRTIIPR
jgi:hypothetical protein